MLESGFGICMAPNKAPASLKESAEFSGSTRG